MPAISKIRFTNVIYENGGKRYNDELFQFDGHNGAVVLENGGGKTVFIQTAIQAVVPHMDLAERKIKNTLSLENGAAHIAIEWILNDRPRRYAVTAVTLFMENNSVNSYKYAYEYGGEDANSIENIPFIHENSDKTVRPSGKGEILDYYQKMARNYMSAKMFDTITEYHGYIEENFKIIESEWRNIGIVNSAEGDVDRYFDGCRTTPQLLNKLLIPVVEKAIEGSYNSDFAKTFEKQREHFKKNKILLEQIHESEETREQLQKYIDVFKKLNQTEEAYNLVKGEAKEVFTFIENTLISKRKESELVDEQLAVLDTRRRTYDKNKLSLRIYEKKLVIKQLKEELSLLQTDFSKISDQYNEKASRKQNIEITDMKADIKKLNEHLSLLTEQLSTIDKDEELKDLLSELEENSKQLKGYFTNEIENLTKEIGRTEGSKERYAEEKLQKEKLYNQVSLILQQTQDEKVRLETINQRIAEEADLIYKSLFDGEEIENASEELVRWQQNKDELSNQLQQIEIDLINLQAEKEQLLHDIEYKRKNKEELSIGESRLKGSLSKFEEEQDKAINLISPYVSHIYLKNSLYEKQSSIEGTLTEKQILMEKRKEAALKEERISSRLADNYADAKVFSADFMLMKIVKELEQITTHTTLGTKYLDGIKDSLDEKMKEAAYSFPYWPISIITTEQDLDTVYKRIERYNEEITHPIVVLTMDRVKGILQGTAELNDLDSKAFTPSYWKGNLNQDTFNTWKMMLTEQAGEKRASRVEAEAALTAITSVKEGIRLFYKDYGYNGYEDIKSSLEICTNELAVSTKEIRDSEKRINDIDQNNIGLNKKRLLGNDDLLKLEGRIKELSLYINKINELKDNEHIYTQVLDKLSGKLHEQKHLSSEIDTASEIINDLVNQLNHLKNKADIINDDMVYQEVKDLECAFSDLSLAALKERRRLLNDSISGKNSDRKTIVERIEEKNIEITNKKKALSLKEKEADYPIEEVTSHYTKELSNLIDQIKELSKRKEQLGIKVKNKDTELAVAVNSKKEMETECINQFGEFAVFEEDYFTVQKSLEQEGKAIKKEKDNLWKDKQKALSIIELLEKHTKYLNDLNYYHSFMIVNCEAGTKELLIDELDSEIEQIKMKLSKLSLEYNDRKKVTQDEKDRLKRFCHQYIKDTKLKEMVISGIDHKQNYDELYEFGNKMLESIKKIIKLAEHDRMTSDKELQIFLEHLHTYVTTVVEELDVIQRKTRINIDGNQKQIFTFDIPKWEESVGKEELRKHIDWIIDQLENIKEEEETDAVTYQKNLENWLSVRRLLQCVLGDQSIKIKCRKVTNDKKISSLPSSWEHSNQWSGGEKWSKNMTLFLGILIYIAEKKQYLSSSDKKHRVVILDNPFGKASSKHVLDPVFFIAERLGFQIIALTAHAEGEFIRNYFPVVYSCKLRSSAEEGKQIMTKEKEIRYAYLKEHDPESLRRFQEVEQISMDYYM